MNDGGFRAFFSLNANGVNDYVSGVTMDQSFEPTSRFSCVNVEGVGFSGAMISKPIPDHLRAGAAALRFIESRAWRNQTIRRRRRRRGRDRQAANISLDRLTVGTHYYTNGGPPETRGFLAGEIAEILIFDHVLSEAHRAEVDHYLANKYGPERFVPLPPELAASRPVPRVANPPAVQMLVPGFAAASYRLICRISTTCAAARMASWSRRPTMAAFTCSTIVTEMVWRTALRCFGTSRVSFLRSVLP